MAKKKTNKNIKINNKLKSENNVSKDIKEELGKICILTILIIAFVLLIIFFPNNETLNAKLQIIEFDNKENTEKVIKTFNIKEEEIITLDKYDANDIKIISINENNLVISRDAIRYEVINQDEPFSGEKIDYTQTVIEKVEYNKEFGLNINEKDPFGPIYEQPRYNYTGKFIK